MSNLSDNIEYILKKMLEDNQGSIEFTRNDLAEQLNCVPSQITYVLQTRFTHDMGFIKESKRGGGGSIRIRQMDFDSPDEQLAYQIKLLPKRLTQQEAYLIIENLAEQEVIKTNEMNIMKAAISHQSLRHIPTGYIAELRTVILANMLLAILQDQRKRDE